jgi:hypothetical protein
MTQTREQGAPDGGGRHGEEKFASVERGEYLSCLHVLLEVDFQRKTNVLLHALVEVSLRASPTI